MLNVNRIRIKQVLNYTWKPLICELCTSSIAKKNTNRWLVL